MSINMTRQEAEMRLEQERIENEEKQFWSIFGVNEPTVNTKNIEYHREPSDITWEDPKKAVPKYNDTVLVAIKWENGYSGIYLGKRVASNDTSWVFDYDNKPVYPIKTKLRYKNRYYGNIIGWTYLKELR